MVVDRIRNHARREGAFTIVEVLVAAFILVAVVGGLIYFIASAGRSQGRAELRKEMVATTDRVVQTMRAERRWLDECTAQTDCEVTSAGDVDVTQYVQPIVRDEAGEELSKYELQVTVKAVDSPADGIGAGEDEDGLILDIFRIKVTLTPGPELLRADPQVRPYQLASTIDASAIGKASGTLLVNVCEVVNQVDQRIAFSGCRADRPNDPDLSRMKPQPTPCQSDADAFISRSDYRENPDILPLGCNHAFDAVGAYRKSMHVRATDTVPFELVHEESGKVYDRSYATRKDDGKYQFGGLPAGTYRIRIDLPKVGGKPWPREPWPERMVPSGSRASVQANQDARALIVVRPTQGTGRHNVYFGRKIYMYYLDIERTEYAPPAKSFEVTTEDGTVKTVTYQEHATYTWLIPRVANNPERENWYGPAWSGIVGIGSKPFDRVRINPSKADQQLNGIGWEPLDRKYQYPFEGLGTGLYSMPRQIPVGDYFRSGAFPDPYTFTFGDFGDNYRCPNPNGPSAPGPAASGCTNVGDTYTWMHAGGDDGQLGDSETSTYFFSNDGECWVRGNQAVLNYRNDLRQAFSEPSLVGGGRYNDPGVANKERRCNRDLNLAHIRVANLVNGNLHGEQVLNGVNISNFFPRPDGTGDGKRFLLDMSYQVGAGCGTCSGTGYDKNENTSDHGVVFDGPATPPPPGGAPGFNLDVPGVPGGVYINPEIDD